MNNVARDGTLVDLIINKGRMIKECLRKSGKSRFTVVQIVTLRFLHSNSPVTMQQLAGFLSVSAPAATLIIDGLEKDKLAKREVGSSDRRQTVVVLTKRGEKVVADAKKLIKKRISAVLKTLTAEEKATLAGILKKIGN